MNWLTQETWSPYVAGAGIGVLLWFTFLFSDRAIGCSTSFARFSGMLEQLIKGKKAPSRTYYQKVKPVLHWDSMLIIGIVMGAFASAMLSGTFSWTWIPGLWQSAFGTTVVWRLLAAFAGGVVMGFGSRWAGGCTSGHGISGGAQLAISSWLAIVCFFAGGIITAMALYGLGA